MLLRLYKMARLLPTRSGQWYKTKRIHITKRKQKIERPKPEAEHRPQQRERRLPPPRAGLQPTPFSRPRRGDPVDTARDAKPFQPIHNTRAFASRHDTVSPLAVLVYPSERSSLGANRQYVVMRSLEPPLYDRPRV